MEVSSKTFQPQEDYRERWSSRLAFYFAAIGSAVGFGNVWRFPSLVYEYGGGAFFIPYVLALIFVGIPLLVLEIALGQYYETGGKINSISGVVVIIINISRNMFICNCRLQMLVFSEASTAVSVVLGCQVLPADTCS
ncbi:hypothetical protein ACHAW6_000718 [Cyclotella cf. meneghiniana]